MASGLRIASAAICVATRCHGCVTPSRCRPWCCPAPYAGGWPARAQSGARHPPTLREGGFNFLRRGVVLRHRWVVPFERDVQSGALREHCGSRAAASALTRGRHAMRRHRGWPATRPRSSRGPRRDGPGNERRRVSRVWGPGSACSALAFNNRPREPAKRN